MSMIVIVLSQCAEVKNTNYYIKHVVLFEGELDSSTPRVSGVFRMAVFEG